jgi:hypothetical protein
MENISLTDRVRNEEVLHREKKGNILQAIKSWKAKWIVYILGRTCLIKHIVEGKIEGRIEVTGRRGRRRRQLLVELKEGRGYRK